MNLCVYVIKTLTGAVDVIASLGAAAPAIAGLGAVAAAAPGRCCFGPSLVVAAAANLEVFGA